MKTHICFIRHGQTEWNNQTRIQGTINNPLNEYGIYQAKTLGKYLKANNNNWDLIVTSPLKRAQETAKIINSELNNNIPLIVIDDFIEREFGKAEGEIITNELFDNILRDQIIDMESSSALQNRIYHATLKLAQENPNKNILVVAHSHVIKGLLTKLDKKYTFRSQILNSALNFFTVENGEVVIEDINISTHLD